MKRDEKALVEFKQIMNDVVHLLRKSTKSQTVYLYWVNRSRKQFVLETNSTSLPNVMFRDRIGFDQHFLQPYVDLKEVKSLKAGIDIEKEDLQHYYDFVPVRHLLLIPFRNNGETVALTVIESETKCSVQEYEPEISAYRSALANVLNTYLELTDLYSQESVWTRYEESLSEISPKQHKVDILNRMAQQMQKLLPTGGVTILLRGMEAWTTVLKTGADNLGPENGLMMEEKSMAYDTLQSGEPQFSIHFNQNPKRVSAEEENTEGATLAIPLLIDGRRHGVALVYDKNALVFKESTKHQLINLARVAVLSIQVNLGKLPVDKDLFTSDYGSFIPDIWELALSHELLKPDSESRQVWFGLITIDNLQALRAKFRLEDLNRIQRTLAKKMNPARFGKNGYIGFNSDYVFTYLIFSKSEQQHNQWTDQVRDAFDQPVELPDGKRVDLQIKLGSIRVDSEMEDVHMVTTSAKKALSGVLNATV